jgi:TonB family protein
MKQKHIGMLILITLFVPASIVFGGNIDKDLQKQLEQEIKNKPLIIRNFYVGNTLEFDSDGKLISSRSPGIWTINGYFQPDKIKLSKKKIVFEGKRLYWSYDYSAKATRMFRCAEKTTINIARLPEYNSHPLIMNLLHKVFFASDESLEDSVPTYWKKLVQTKFILKDFANQKSIVIMNGNVPVQGEIENSRILHRVNPNYTEEARRARLSGVITISVIIDEEGKVTVQEILRPLGAGLDESAIKACQTWKFAPGLLNGNPVKVLATIEVVFKLY